LRIIVALALSGLALAGAEQLSLDKARQLLASGASTEAVGMLRQIVKAEPRNADARLLLGRVLALEGVRNESLEQLAEAVRLRPDSAAAHNTFGIVLSRFVENQTARAEFEKAIQLDPRLAEAHVNLSLLLAQTSEYELAGKHLARALELLGDSPQAAYPHLLQGRILGAQDKGRLAAKEFEAAIRLRPNYAEAYLELAVTRQKLLDDAGCMRALLKAVELAPKNAEVRYRLGTEYLHRDELAKAVEHLGVANRLKPDDRGILYSYSRALRLNGQDEEATTVSKRLSEILQTSREATKFASEAANLTNQGVELEKRGNTQAAIEKYRAALELDPMENTVRRNLGLALCRAGRFDEGIRELKEILRLDPNDAATTRALYIALEQARGGSRK
jgi:protein O-GlcNAc transferase